MKAVFYEKYGSPDVLQLRDVPKPVPENNEVCVKTHATAVSPADCAFREGKPLITRAFTGLRKPRVILGAVLAGDVESVGKDVRQFKVGDPVFASSGTDFGALAEYKCLPENGTIAIKPSNMSYEEAAPVCDGALTALIFLMDKAKIQPGQKILINGASGSIGTYAVQLAKYFEAEVIGVCSTTNLDMVRSLGADSVIDYTKTDFTTEDVRYDIVFDTVGKRSFSDCRRVLKHGGLYLTTVPTATIFPQMLWTSFVGSKKAVFAATGLMETKERIMLLKDLIESDKIKTVIDRCYPLDEVAEAHRYVEKGHKKGNVVITVQPG